MKTIDSTLPSPEVAGTTTSTPTPTKSGSGAAQRRSTPKVSKPKTAIKTPEPAKLRKAPKADVDPEPTDRLPSTLPELRQTKGGLAACLFLEGKDPGTIAKELAATFKLAEVQAMKITRRITGRVRLYQRVFELVPKRR
jgi:hypothetical protein